MDINNLIRVSVFSFFVILILNWIYFFNWIGLIGKLVYLINPEIPVKNLKRIVELQNIKNIENTKESGS